MGTKSLVAALFVVLLALFCSSVYTQETTINFYFADILNGTRYSEDSNSALDTSSSKASLDTSSSTTAASTAGSTASTPMVLSQADTTHSLTIDASTAGSTASAPMLLSQAVTTQSFIASLIQSEVRFRLYSASYNKYLFVSSTLQGGDNVVEARSGRDDQRTEWIFQQNSGSDQVLLYNPATNRYVFISSDRDGRDFIMEARNQIQQRSFFYINEGSDRTITLDTYNRGHRVFVSNTKDGNDNKVEAHTSRDSDDREKLQIQLLDPTEYVVRDVQFNAGSGRILSRYVTAIVDTTAVRHCTYAQLTTASFTFDNFEMDRRVTIRVPSIDTTNPNDVIEINNQVANTYEFTRTDNTAFRTEVQTDLVPGVNAAQVNHVVISIPCTAVLETRYARGGSLTSTISGVYTGLNFRGITYPSGLNTPTGADLQNVLTYQSQSFNSLINTRGTKEMIQILNDANSLTRSADQMTQYFRIQDAQIARAWELGYELRQNAHLDPYIGYVFPEYVATFIRATNYMPHISYPSSVWIFESTDKIGGDNVVEAALNGQNQQMDRSRWNLLPLEGGYFQIQESNSKRSMFVSTDTIGGTNVIETASNGRGDRVKWQIQPNTDGTTSLSIRNQDGKYAFVSTDKIGGDNVLEAGSDSRYNQAGRSRFNIYYRKADRNFAILQGDRISSVWLNQLDDNVLISEINLPGTHDSGAILTAELPKTFYPWSRQTLELTDQLRTGVRVLDIRLQVSRDSAGGYVYKICHGSLGLKLGLNVYGFFEPALTAVGNFLKQFSKEFVVMSIKIDDTTEGVGPSDDYISDLSRFVTQTAANTGFPLGYLDPSNPAPRLGDVRGKLLIINRLSESFAVAPSKWYFSFNAAESVGIHLVQDFSNTADRTTKTQQVAQQFDKVGDGTILINFASAGPGILVVGAEVGVMASILKRDLANRPKKIGWLMMDFSSYEYATKTPRKDLGTLVDLVIASNFGYKGYLDRVDARVFDISSFDYLNPFSTKKRDEPSEARRKNAPIQHRKISQNHVSF